MQEKNNKVSLKILGYGLFLDEYSLSLNLFLLSLRIKYKLGPDNPYNKKKMNKTLGGSKDINDIIRDIINSIMYGTFCFKFKSLKLM